MRCSDCLAEMKPHEGGFRCKSCGRMSYPQQMPEDDGSTSDEDSAAHQVTYEPPGRVRKSSGFRWLIILASLGAFVAALAAGWYFTPQIGPARIVPKAAISDIYSGVSADGVTPLETSAIFNDAPGPLGVRSSVTVPAGLTVFPAGSADTPALALIPDLKDAASLPARDRALLLVPGSDGRTFSGKRLWLPPAGRLQAISRTPSGELFVVSRQADGLLLQKISADSQTLWTETLASASANHPDPVRITLPRSGDGAFVLLGDDAGMEGIYFDTIGNKLWSRRISDTSGRAFIATSPFDEFLIVLEEADQTVLITLDQEGGEAWRRTWQANADQSVASVAVDALGSVFVLMTPAGHLFSVNSVGSPELDLELSEADSSSGKSCELWPGPATISLLCPQVTGVERTEYSRIGARLDTDLLQTHGEWQNVSLLASEDLLIAWSANADGVLSIDLLGPAQSKPAEDRSAAASAIPDSPAGSQSAPRQTPVEITAATRPPEAPAAPEPER